MKKIQFDFSKTGTLYYDGTYLCDRHIQLDLSRLDEYIKVKVPKVCSSALEMKIPFSLTGGIFSTQDVDVSFITQAGSPWENEKSSSGNLIKCEDSKLTVEILGGSLKLVNMRLLGVALETGGQSIHRLVGIPSHYPLYELPKTFDLMYREDSPLFKLYEENRLLGILGMLRLSDNNGFFAAPEEEIWGKYLKYVD